MLPGSGVMECAMLKVIWYLVGGMITTVITIFLSSLIVVFGTPEKLSDVEYLTNTAYVSLVLWCMITTFIMLSYAQQVQIVWKHPLLRLGVIFGPVTLGWYFFTLGSSWTLQIGMVFSSAVFIYQTRVWESRRR